MVTSLADAMETWVGDMSMEIGDEAALLVGTSVSVNPVLTAWRPDPEFVDCALTLLDAVDAAAPVTMPLYSGHGGKDPIQAGDTMTIPLLSASTDRNVAAAFAEPGGVRDARYETVVYEIAPGARAVPEAEGHTSYVTGGTFAVDAVERQPDNAPTVVRLTYVGPIRNA